MNPNVLSFAYLLTDGASIAEAKKEEKPWSSEEVADLKKRIKALHMAVQDELCCYCRRDLTAEFTMVIDIEHVLPSSEYQELMFNVCNLSVSCKRCNMRIKNDDRTFLVDEANLNGDYWNTDQYKLIHPNLDDYESCLLRHSLQLGRRRLVFYQIVNGSPKGAYTKKYFDLDQFEIDSFDDAQRHTISPEVERIRTLKQVVMDLQRRGAPLPDAAT